MARKGFVWSVVVSASAAVFLVLVGFQTAYATDNGNIGIMPQFTGAPPADVIGLRYKLRVNANDGNGLKILFGFNGFYAPGSSEIYQLESNLYSNWYQYTDTDCKGFPPVGTYHPGQAGLWMSVPDYNKHGMVGVRQVDSVTQAAFPRQNSGIDNISGLTKIETISQFSVTGKDIEIEYTRGDTFTTPLSGWGYRFGSVKNDQNTFDCMADLPSGVTYRIWNAKATTGGVAYGWQFALPDANARYFNPNGFAQFVSEFLQTQGFFQVYLWDASFEKESTMTWQPITKWNVYYHVDSHVNTTWGVRRATYAGENVVEFSNDGTDTYYRVGNIFDVPQDSSTVVPPPAPAPSPPPPTPNPTPSPQPPSPPPPSPPSFQGYLYSPSPTPTPILFSPITSTNAALVSSSVSIFRPQTFSSASSSAGPTVLLNTPATSSGVLISRRLAFGSRGKDVVALQQYLQNTDYLSKIYQTTGFFGLATQAAIQKFQCAKIQTCSGTPISTGYGATGPRTRKALQEQ